MGDSNVNNRFKPEDADEIVEIIDGWTFTRDHYGAPAAWLGEHGILVYPIAGNEVPSEVYIHVSRPNSHIIPLPAYILKKLLERHPSLPDIENELEVQGREGWHLATDRQGDPGYADGDFCMVFMDAESYSVATILVHNPLDEEEVIIPLSILQLVLNTNNTGDNQCEAYETGNPQPTTKGTGGTSTKTA